jgi:hypothetical protein
VPDPDRSVPGSHAGPDDRRPPGTFRIGAIGGTDVLVTSSWFLIAGLIAVVLAPRIEDAQPGLGALKYVAGLACAVILYASVLLHEVSHALMARHFGFSVSSITLHFLGGMTAIEGESRRPKEEFLIAVVGPLTPLAEAVRRANEAHAGSIVTVSGSGHPVGLVNEAAVLATPEDRRPWVSVAAVSRSLDEGLQLPASITGEDLVMAITRTPAEEYLLVEADGAIYGVLATKDVDQAFRDGGGRG